MIRIYDGLYVGDQTDCNRRASDWWAVWSEAQRLEFMNWVRVKAGE